MGWTIFGIVISSFGVLLSLLLFNASINNNRKIILNDVIKEINRGLFCLFTEDHNKEYKMKQFDGFVKNTIKIDAQLNQIEFKNNILLPGIPHSTSYIADKAIQTFDLNKAYKSMIDYFESRNIYGLDIALEFYDDRLMALQFYALKHEYIKKFFIGPIIGLRISAIKHTNEAYISKDQSLKIPIDRIGNKQDLKTYYDNFYVKLIPRFFQEPKSFDRIISNIVNETEKGKERPITFYF